MSDQIFDVKSYAEKARQAVAEGIVMLRNEGGVLPLAPGERIALFGRSQFHYYKSGTGSGGLVNTSYVTGIREALKNSDYVLNAELEAVYESWIAENPFDTGVGWAAEPWFQKEMPVSEELAAKARSESDTAIVVIGRTAGEDKDNKAEAGSYLLTAEEEDLLQKVCGAFERTVVLLNVGNIIDMKWVETCKPQAVLYVWQGGQEGGNGVLDVLSGRVSPSGKLADTIAGDITDYPSTKNHGDEKRNIYEEDIYVGYRYFETFAREKALYPFGFGLSYTTFALDEINVEENGENLRVSVNVTNQGKVSGKEVVQVYCGAPQGGLGQPARSLCGFAKTRPLAPGETEKLTVLIDRRTLASYDDSGVTGNKSCYVMEAGVWKFYVGTDVRSAVLAGQIEYPETVVVERLEEACAPVTPFQRIRPVKENGENLRAAMEEVPLRTISPSDRRQKNLPETTECTGDLGYKLADVEVGTVTMETFLNQLSNNDLACMMRGEGMCSPKVTPGTAGAFGGVTERLKGFGIPIACCADGPSGIRMDCGSIAFAMPNGTCLACTFNEALLEELYQWEGMELRRNKVDTLLGPGINIHRTPLNGRNFEYFSEDPLLTGKMAAAQLRGMGRYGVTGTIKHFACNSQEYKRHMIEAVISERALREIYLRAYEIAVKEGGAYSIMSSYNPINGFWAASNYDLMTTILRKEWGYQGLVMTDWWGGGNDEGEVGRADNTAAMARAQNDLFMVTLSAEENTQNDNSMESLAKGTVTRGEYLRNAANICRYLLRTPAWLRMKGVETELDRRLDACESWDAGASEQLLRMELSKDGGIIPVEEMNTARGNSILIELAVRERGFYRLEFFCCVPGQESLAQVPVTISQDKQLLKTISLTGEDKEWLKQEIALNPFFRNTGFLKFYFGQGGMKLKDVKVVLTESLEEKIRARTAAHAAE
ncbi:MAG: beta-glucosidase [Lachnospiraceae bacterium]|nr:beta-glucosidase [Lachnospiraceae bacterium]